MSDDWKVDYKGYGIAVSRRLHDGHANFTITKPGADGEPEMVRQGFGKGGHDSDDDEWSDAYTAAHAYIDASLPPLADPSRGRLPRWPARGTDCLEH